MTARFFAGFVGVFAVAALAVALAVAGEPRREDASIVAQSDGSTQRYVVVVPDRFDPAVERPLMVALHGHGSDRW